MLVIKPKIFDENQVLCGLSTKIGLSRIAPYHFNLSYSVNDDPEKVKENRERFFAMFGLTSRQVAFQKQIHSDNISVVSAGGNSGESDALISSERELGLIISTADCIPLFIYDPVNKIVAGVHAGWRSTEKNITSKVIGKMITEFNCRVEELKVYIGPSICARCYEVGVEFSEKFDQKYLTPFGHKFRLNLPLRNYDLLLQSGVRKKNIQVSSLCTYEMRDMLQSYRRDGAMSGRALGLIAMRNTNAK